MKLFTFITLIAITAAAQLPSRSYLPQTQGSGSSGSFQGNFQQSSYQSSGSGAGGDSGNRRPQQEQEKNAAILKLDQEASENGDYHYSYETSNGIRAEEAGNTVESSGGFSYKGDDGNTYTVTFTAGEGGFRPQGAHLPVAPPTPDDILKGLEQNAKDEAAGIFDDGQYHPDAKGSGQFSSSSGKFGSSSSQFGSSSSQFGSSSSQFGSSSSQFGSSKHQTSFNSNSGYTY